METKTKCLKCGYSLFFEKGKAQIECPKCKQVWKIVEENEELFLEPIEQAAEETVL